MSGALTLGVPAASDQHLLPRCGYSASSKAADRRATQTAEAKQERP
jgi:hypothetical protein